MATRRDAASALFAFANALADRLREAGGLESVWNYGIVAVRPGAANVVPAEAELTVEFESHLPLRVNRYELRENMVAAGEWRGGIGSVREFTYLTDGGFSVEGDGQKHPPGASTAALTANPVSSF